MTLSAISIYQKGCHKSYQMTRILSPAESQYKRSGTCGPETDREFGI